MKVPVSIPLLFLLISVFSGSAMAQSVHTYVDRDSLRVGDILEYTIVLHGNYGEVIFPGESDFEDESLDFLSRQRFQEEAGKDSLVYRLQFFGTEDFTIGRKEIRLQMPEADTLLYTTPVSLFFKTSLAEGDEAFRPLKPIFAFAENWWPYIAGLLLLIIAGILFYLWYTRREPAPEPEPAPAPAPFSNPLNELKQTLDELQSVHSLHTEEEFETFYITLGDAIRLYLKRVYEIAALEMTTREINDALRKELAPSEIIQITRSVLNEADMVKFANFHPGTEGAASVLRKAREFVETADVVHYEQIKYMKYKYEVDRGIISPASSHETTPIRKEEK